MNASPAQRAWSEAQYRKSVSDVSVRPGYHHGLHMSRGQAEQFDQRFDSQRRQRDLDEKRRYRSHPGGIHAAYHERYAVTDPFAHLNVRTRTPGEMDPLTHANAGPELSRILTGGKVTSFSSHRRQ